MLRSMALASSLYVVKTEALAARKEVYSSREPSQMTFSREISEVTGAANFWALRDCTQNEFSDFPAII